MPNKTPYELHPERFLTVHGRAFPDCTVRLVLKGDRYGSRGCLVYGQDEPCVEFYDNDYDFSPWLGTRGQFVSSYNLGTLLEHSGGLYLDGGEPKWTLDANEMQEIRAWLVARLIAELKDCRRKEP